MDDLEITGGGVSIRVSRERGIIRSIRTGSGGVEYAGNSENAFFPAILQKNQWIGDWLFRVFDKGAWHEENTSCSPAKVTPGPNSLTVDYGISENSGGLRRISLSQRFFSEKGGVFWEAEIKNLSGRELEIGEISLAFPLNTNYSGFFTDREHYGTENWRGEKQRLWHEERVQQYLSVNGASSYVFAQRAKGDFPALMFTPLENTPIEAAYQMETVGGQFSTIFEGPYYLSLYSKAARHSQKWKTITERQRYWLNGQSSCVLEKDGARKFRFAFSGIKSGDEIGETLYQNGKLRIDTDQGMIIPVNRELRLRVKSRSAPEFTPLSSGVEIIPDKRENDCYFFRMRFKSAGHKKISVTHGGETSFLFFFALDEIEESLKTHARFIAEKQYYDNPADPYGRHHCFLPYDGNLDSHFLESAESWQVGALDEACLPVAMFLAEKNFLYPDDGEIALLEEFIEESLFGKLQNRETFFARRGLYWEEKQESDKVFGGKWDKALSETVTRTFNYPLICNIYFSMYKIASAHELTKKRSAREYLELTYKTAQVWLETEPKNINCAPAGAVIVEIIKELKETDPAWFSVLDNKLRKTAEINRDSVYPYGSELFIDQTPHDQFHAMMDHYNFAEKKDEAFTVTEALRAGRQPAWFFYGNESRGSVCCWYATALNSRVLFRKFEEKGGTETLRLAYGGLSTCLATLRSSGFAHGWFIWWPDRMAFDTRSLDTDMALFGYLRSAKAYAVQDEIFGLHGYGCDIERKEGKILVTPRDGISRRVFLSFCGIDIKFASGKIELIELDESRKICRVKLTAPHSGAAQGYILIDGGRDWKVTVNGSERAPGEKTTFSF